MTAEELAEALSRLVADIEKAGLAPEVVLAEIEALAAAMRLYEEGDHHSLPPGSAIRPALRRASSPVVAWR